MQTSPFANAIRQATPADYDGLTAVWEASVRATHHFLSEEAIQYFKPLVRHEYLAAVNLFCIDDEQASIIGFAGVADDKLEMLFVHPHHQGRGVGKRLLQYAIEHLGVQHVDVNEQNENAVQFYLRFHFMVTGRSDTDAMGKPYPILHLALQPPCNP